MSRQVLSSLAEIGTHPAFMSAFFACCSAGAGVTSSMPMEKPRLPMKRADSLASRFMQRAATSGEKSVTSTWWRWHTKRLTMPLRVRPAA